MLQKCFLHSWIFILVFVLIGEGRALARVVNSVADEVRINGFQQHLDHLKELDEDRLSDVGDIAHEKIAWEKKMREALEQYRLEKAHQAKTVDDTGEEYQEDVDDRLIDYKEHDEDRRQFVKERDEVRAHEKRDVDLSEEQEYFLASNTDRVDWKKRKFFEKQSSGAASFVPATGFGGENSPPPPPAPAVPYEPPQNSWENAPPPPPPPGMFDNNEESNPF